MSNDKTNQRNRLREARAQLSRADVETHSAEICDRLFASVDWAKNPKVHVYLPIEASNEVNTWPLLAKLWSLAENIDVSTSIYGANKAMQHVQINPDTEYTIDELGIPVPSANFTQEVTKYDFVVIPVLGFDEKLNRLGYGRGVYDTFLAKQTKAKKIGLAYEFSKLRQIKNEPHDVPLNEIITEVKLYN